MKYGKVLIPHVYSGKRRHTGEIYPVRRSDYRLLVTLGRIEIVPDPNAEAVPGGSLKEQYLTSDFPKDHEGYRTTAMEAEPEPVKSKRPYRRKKAISE